MLYTGNCSVSLLMSLLFARSNGHLDGSNSVINSFQLEKNLQKRCTIGNDISDGLGPSIKTRLQTKFHVFKSLMWTHNLSGPKGPWKCLCWLYFLNTALFYFYISIENCYSRLCHVSFTKKIRSVYLTVQWKIDLIQIFILWDIPRK